METKRSASSYIGKWVRVVAGDNSGQFGEVVQQRGSDWIDVRLESGKRVTHLKPTDVEVVMAKTMKKAALLGSQPDKTGRQRTSVSNGTLANSAGGSEDVDPDYNTFPTVATRSKAMGEYYAELDDESGLWCVFHTDKNSGHAFASYADKHEAEADAKKRNQSKALKGAKQMKTKDYGIEGEAVPGEEAIEEQIDLGADSVGDGSEADDQVEPWGLQILRQKYIEHGDHLKDHEGMLGPLEDDAVRKLLEEEQEWHAGQMQKYEKLHKSHKRYKDLPPLSHPDDALEDEMDDKSGLDEDDYEVKDEDLAEVEDLDDGLDVEDKDADDQGDMDTLEDTGVSADSVDDRLEEGEHEPTAEEVIEGMEVDNKGLDEFGPGAVVKVIDQGGAQGTVTRQAGAKLIIKLDSGRTITEYAGACELVTPAKKTKDLAPAPKAGIRGFKEEQQKDTTKTVRSAGTKALDGEHLKLVSGDPTWHKLVRAMKEGAYDARALADQLAREWGTFTAQEAMIAAKQGKSIKALDDEELDEKDFPDDVVEDEMPVKGSKALEDLDDTERKMCGKAAQFLKAASEPESEWSDEHRMNSFHFHKALNDLVEFEDEEKSTAICMTCHGTKIGPGGGPCPECQGASKAFDENGDPIEEETKAFDEEDDGIDAKDLAPDPKNDSGFPADKMDESTAKVSSAGTKDMGEMVDEDMPVKSLHPSRELAGSVSKFFKELSETRDFGDDQRERSAAAAKALDDLAEVIEEEGKDLGDDDIDVYDDVEEKDGEELYEPGEMGEKAQGHYTAFKTDTGEWYVGDDGDHEDQGPFATQQEAQAVANKLNGKKAFRRKSDDELDKDEKSLYLKRLKRLKVKAIEDNDEEEVKSLVKAIDKLEDEDKKTLRRKRLKKAIADEDDEDTKKSLIKRLKALDKTEVEIERKPDGTWIVTDFHTGSLLYKCKTEKQAWDYAESHRLSVQSTKKSLRRKSAVGSDEWAEEEAKEPEHKKLKRKTIDEDEVDEKSLIEIKRAQIVQDKSIKEFRAQMQKLMNGFAHRN